MDSRVTLKVSPDLAELIEREFDPVDNGGSAVDPWTQGVFQKVQSGEGTHYTVELSHQQFSRFHEKFRVYLDDFESIMGKGEKQTIAEALKPIYIEMVQKMVEKFSQDQLLAVYFSTPGCGSCKKAKPSVKTVLGNAEGVRLVEFTVELNTMSVMKDLGFEPSFPVLAFFHQGRLLRACKFDDISNPNRVRGVLAHVRKSTPTSE